MRLSHYLPLSKLNSAVFVLATDVAQLDRGAPDEIYRASALQHVADARAALDALEAELLTEPAYLAMAPSRGEV